jgi:hypothetical protein
MASFQRVALSPMGSEYTGNPDETSHILLSSARLVQHISPQVGVRRSSWRMTWRVRRQNVSGRFEARLMAARMVRCVGYGMAFFAL